jgi:hypothetical protein
MSAAPARGLWAYCDASARALEVRRRAGRGHDAARIAIDLGAPLAGVRKLMPAAAMASHAAPTSTGAADPVPIPVQAPPAAPPAAPPPPSASTSWESRPPAAKGEAVAALVAEGFSAADIAEKLGAPSRRAVLGVLYRYRQAHGLEAPPRPRKEKPAAKAAAPAAPRVPAKTTAPPPASRPPLVFRTRPEAEAPRPRRSSRLPDWLRAEPAPNDRADLTGRPLLSDATAGQCRYPLWPDAARPKAGELFICGLPVVEGHSWCASCCRRVYAAGRAAA